MVERGRYPRIPEVWWKDTSQLIYSGTNVASLMFEIQIEPNYPKIQSQDCQFSLHRDGPHLERSGVSRQGAAPLAKDLNVGSQITAAFLTSVMEMKSADHESLLCDTNRNFGCTVSSRGAHESCLASHPKHHH